MTSISQIVDRAAHIEAIFHAPAKRMQLVASLEAIQASQHPLDLDRMLTGRPFDFMHDIAGIWNNFDLETGAFQNCFLPRFTCQGRA